MYLFLFLALSKWCKFYLPYRLLLNLYIVFQEQNKKLKIYWLNICEKDFGGTNVPPIQSESPETEPTGTNSILPDVSFFSIVHPVLECYHIEEVDFEFDLYSLP